MSFINFALVAENEVFYVFNFNEDHPVAEKWIAAMRSGVSLVGINEYAKIRKGYLYSDGEFYGPEDVGFTSPIAKQDPDYSVSLLFAGILDNEVIGLLTFVKDELPSGYYELIHAAMSSNPTYHEVNENVQAGWMFNGTTFEAPGE